MSEIPVSSEAGVSVPPDREPGFWTIVGEALRGSRRRDYTEGPIGRAILLLAIPMVLEMVLESVFAVVDVFWVAKLGPDSVATIGLTESMLALIYAVAIGLSMAATATVARRTGEKNPEGASLAAVQVVALGILIAVPIGITGALLAPKLLALMGAPAGVLANVGFTRVMLGCNVVILLLFLINAIFRGVGDAAIAMRVLWLANIINLLLDPCFIFGLGPFPALGVQGAAVATTCGRGIGVVVQLVTLFRGKRRIAIARRHLRLDPKAMISMLRLSGNAIVQVAVSTASWIGLVRILSTFGASVLAGYTIAIRILVFALLPSWGMANAAATMVGQSLGAGKPDRAEKSVWIAGFYNMIFLGSVGVLFEVLTRPLVGLFTADPAVASVGVECLRTVAAGFLFYAYGMVLVQAFNGAGDTFTPTVINLVCFWLWEIPLAYILAKRVGMGPPGVFRAIAIAFSTVAVVGAIAFRRGKWRQKKV